MPIEIRCTSCSYQARVKDRLAGKLVACPECGEAISVPEVPAGTWTTPPVQKRPESPSQRRTAPKPPPPARSENGTGPQESHPHPRMVLIAAAAGLLFVTGTVAAFMLGRQSTDPPAVASGTQQQEAPSSDSQEASADEPAPPDGTDSSEATDHSQEASEAALAQGTPEKETARLAEPPSASKTTEASPDADSEQPAEPPARPLTTTVTFEELVLDEPVTSMAMTEDGEYLVLSHQAAHQITFWDVVKREVAVTATTESPRSILCRGGFAFVANHGEGTISVFSRRDNWRRTNELQVIKPRIVHLSAPGGRNFRNEILVTCHGEERQSSYRDSHIYVVDVQRDTCKPIGQAALATASYDGRVVMTQQSFNLSPSGGLSAHNYRAFTSGSKSEPVFRGGIQQTPYVYQVSAGSYWLGRDIVFGGVPIAKLNEDGFGELIVPDLSHQRIIYSLTKETFRAHQLNTGLTEVGSMRRVSYPPPYDDFSKVYHHLYRMRDYLLDHPVAHTHGDRLCLFVLTADGGAVLAAETLAYESSSAVADRGASPPTAAADRSSAGRPSDSGRPSPSSSPAPATDLAGILDGLPEMIPAEEEFRFRLKLPKESSAELMSPIPGLTLGGNGELRWIPKADQVGEHEIKLRIEQSGENVFERPTIEVIDQELVASVQGDLSTLREFERLELDVDHYFITPGQDGESLLLLQGEMLRVLGEDGLTVNRERELPKRYKFLREREEAYVAIAESPPTLDVIDKRRLTVRKSVDLTAADVRVMEITDLAIHPAAGISYVGIKHDINLPRYMVLVVHEQSGRVEAPGILGTWVNVAPDGKRLYTGYRDIYQRGSRFHINPGWRLLEVPEYGNVDMLLAWEISNQYELVQVVREAGGNGYGIRLSPDGKRLTYLSHVGFPLHSGRLTGYDATDFNGKAVRYETKGRGVCTELTYHPFLPLAAVPGSGSAVLFHRETGEVRENMLLLTAAGLGETEVDRLYFSPDGRHLIFVCSGGETGRYLRKVRLKLTSEELSKPLPPPPRPVPPRRRGLET